MDIDSKRQLAEALLKCPSMASRPGRDAIVRELPAVVQHTMVRSDVALQDVAALISTVLNYETGLSALVKAVRFFEGDSLGMREVDRIVTTWIPAVKTSASPSQGGSGVSPDFTPPVPIAPDANRSVAPGIVNPPPGFQLPAGHAYLQSGPQPGEHVLLRLRDRQSVLYLPLCPLAPRPFMIDQHLVTNAQFSEFLNAPEMREYIDMRLEGRLFVAASAASDERLAGDGQAFWRQQRWQSQPWGLEYLPGQWRPISGSDYLPVTLVTVLGASWYAWWARQQALDALGTLKPGTGLPVESQWLVAAYWDYRSGRRQAFPWGDRWVSTNLNSASSWAGQDFEDATDPEYIKWLQASLAPRPLAVNAFPSGASPSGMFDALGNVWEWLAERNQAGQSMIRGGACTSPRARLDKPDFRQSDTANPYIGFRCCWSLP